MAGWLCGYGHSEFRKHSFIHSEFRKHSYRGSHVGGLKNAHQPIFPYNIIENYLASLACNSVFIGPNNFKSDIETRCMVL